MYYCNCLESWKLKGKTTFNKREREVGVYMYQPVDTQDGNCTHCKYAAFFSKELIQIVEDTNVRGKKKRQQTGHGKQSGLKGCSANHKQELDDEFIYHGDIGPETYPSDVLPFPSATDSTDKISRVRHG